MQQNTTLMARLQLSIIIPVYQVEKYVRASMESIFRQGIDKQEFEVLVVNDGTKDHSMDMIADICSQHVNVKIINQSNQGLSAARNNGMQQATGKYTLFLDSDDLLIDNTLSHLLDEAKKTEPDMLIAGMKKMTDEEIEHGIPTTKNSLDCTIMTGESAFVNVLDARQCYVWKTLYRTDFLRDNGIKFIEGIYFEDIPFTTECYLKADKCVVTEFPFYIYRQRAGSIVSTFSKKKMTDINTVLARLCQIKRDYVLSNEQQRKLDKVISTTLAIELWYIIHNNELIAQRKEIIGDLRHKIPDLQLHGSWKECLLTFFLRYIPNLYLWLRAKL